MPDFSQPGPTATIPAEPVASVCARYAAPSAPAEDAPRPVVHHCPPPTPPQEAALQAALAERRAMADP